jgi:hypothetical protein
VIKFRNLGQKEIYLKPNPLRATQPFHSVKLSSEKKSTMDLRDFSKEIKGLTINPAVISQQMRTSRTPMIIGKAR